MKRCTKCGEDRAESEFYRNQGRLRPDCKTCHRAAVGRFQAENPAKLKAATAAYRAANKKEIAERTATYRRENQEKLKAREAAYRAANRGRECARVLAYFQTEAGRISQRKALAKRRSAYSEPYSAQGIYERDGWVCQICGAAVLRDIRYPHPASASIDHKTPISRGGSDTADNVRLAHLRCNTVKHAGDDLTEDQVLRMACS